MVLFDVDPVTEQSLVSNILLQHGASFLMSLPPPTSSPTLTLVFVGAAVNEK